MYLGGGIALMIAKYKGVSGLKKRIVLVLTLVAMVAIFVPYVASASEVGYVDFELLFYTHPEYDVKNVELQEAAEKLYEEMQNEVAKIETEEAVEELGAYFESQFEQLEQNVRVELVSFILKIIGEVAEAHNVSTVLPESSIIYGGVDLTTAVVEAMYKSYGISVPSSIRELL